MATNYAATQVAKSATLTAAGVDSVQLTQVARSIRVINRSATATDVIYVTIGTLQNKPADPTSAGDDCYAVMPGAAGVLLPWPIESINLRATNPAYIKLISATTPAYTVQVERG